MNLTDILNSIFGKHDISADKPKVADKVENNETMADFESKLFYIIDALGDKEIQYSHTEYTYKYKSIKFCRNECYYISINDVDVYIGYGNHDNDDRYWKNDIITTQCKSRVIKLVDDLYIKALAKERSDRIELLRSSQDKVRSGCMELL